MLFLLFPIEEEKHTVGFFFKLIFILFFFQMYFYLGCTAASQLRKRYSFESWKYMQPQGDKLVFMVELYRIFPFFSVGLSR